MRVSLYVPLLFLVLCPSYSWAWTASEWLGVVEAVSGTVVLRAHDLPSSDTCENCSGTGRLGDGVISVKCPVCDGTGKAVKTRNVYSSVTSGRDCPTCGVPATMKTGPTPTGMEAPVVQQDADSSGGGTYKRGLLRRR
jgi:DnaJ-class molecular chaperone